MIKEISSKRYKVVFTTTISSNTFEHPLDAVRKDNVHELGFDVEIFEEDKTVPLFTTEDFHEWAASEARDELYVKALANEITNLQERIHQINTKYEPLVPLNRTEV